MTVVTSSLPPESPQPDSSDWRRWRACRTAAPDLFFPEDRYGNEPAYPPPEVLRFCNFCVVRAECLMDGYDQEFGIYGGMTGYQRAQVNRKLQRQKCPSCTSTDVVIENNHEICLACGVSWEII